ncbi:hypothetical protein IW262DRAFT_1052340 [Armillaria fumosa]|nr:hypothetical protein IW262DRAFT_1052340 [Armillaria fumosa]
MVNGSYLIGRKARSILNANQEADVKVPRVYMAFTSHNPVCTVGYIIMEYIDAPDCKWVARAMDTLIHIEAPSTVPGHIDDGVAIHSMFSEWASVIKHESSKKLQDHVNVILSVVQCYYPEGCIREQDPQVYSESTREQGRKRHFNNVFRLRMLPCPRLRRLPNRYPTSASHFRRPRPHQPTP